MGSCNFLYVAQIGERFTLCPVAALEVRIAREVPGSWKTDRAEEELGVFSCLACSGCLACLVCVAVCWDSKCSSRQDVCTRFFSWHPLCHFLEIFTMTMTMYKLILTLSSPTNDQTCESSMSHDFEDSSGCIMHAQSLNYIGLQYRSRQWRDGACCFSMILRRFFSRRLPMMTTLMLSPEKKARLSIVVACMISQNGSEWAIASLIGDGCSMMLNDAQCILPNSKCWKVLRILAAWTGSQILLPLSPWDSL